jgi:GDP-L-fucose synthase
MNPPGYWAERRVVVTGGGGFLGSHVINALRDAGCGDVFAVRSREYDLTHEDAAAQLFADHPADVVMHLAGYVGGIGANKAYPADFFYRNLMMGTLVIDQAWRAGAEKVVAAGAGCGYPEEAPLPIKEEDFWQGFPQTLSAPYSLANRMLHVQSMAYWRQHGFPVVVAIPGNIYGPYDNFDLEAAHVIPALVRKFVEAADDGHASVTVWGSGTPTRDFVYAGDVARGMLLAAERCDEPALFNLSTGDETSIRGVVERLTALTGFAGKVEWDTERPDGQARRVFDVSKADKDLGFQASTTLGDGLKLTVDWYRANRSVARNVVGV